MLRNYIIALIIAIGFDLVSVLNLTLIGLLPELVLTAVGIFVINYFTSVSINPFHTWTSTAINAVRLVELVPIVDLFPFFTVSVLLQWWLGW